MKSAVRIIFYDGECGLCQRSIRWLASADRKQLLTFAPLNGKTYQLYFQHPAVMDTVLYYRDGKIFEKSTAVLECLSDLPDRHWLSFLMRFVPRMIRDFFYDRVAANRHKLTCPYFARDARFLE